MGLDELHAELGAPDVEHRERSGIWLVFHLPSFDLRVRCTGDAHPVADSCSASLKVPRPTLAEATRGLGLWPACQPDEAAAAVSTPLVRRGLTGPGGELLSMTATVRAGRFTRVTVFDEEPEW
jgi:hypothetical protein